MLPGWHSNFIILKIAAVNWDKEREKRNSKYIVYEEKRREIKHL
jgi:hypothetical protein